MDPLQPGDPTRIGTYTVLARLGAGGMGVVYLARSAGGRTVAVKIIRESLAADPEYAARFAREVAAARRVTGTFTAPVLDADPAARPPWLVTAFLPGLSLADAVRRFGPVPPDAVRALAVGLAEALVAIHRAGVVHRDLKPENVMLTAGGPRVIDFGIARPSDSPAITSTGVSLGTPGFMAPEQIAAGEVGPASDVFALGAVLVFAATGTGPFGDGSTRSKLSRTQDAVAEPAGITEPWLRDLVGTCLRPRPGQRPTARDLLHRLGRGGVSLHGTRWLPAAVAEAVDGRTARAAQLPAVPLIQLDAPRPDPPAGEAGPMGADTVDPVIAPDPPSPGRPGVGRRVALVAGVAGVAGVAVLGTGGWLLTRDEDRKRPPAAGHPRRTRSPGTPPTPTATPRWTVRVSDQYPDLAVAGGLVLAWSDKKLHALDPASGRTRWSRAALRLTVADGVAYVVDGSAFPWALCRIHADSGATAWRTSPGWFPYAGPVVAGSLAVFGDEDHVRAVSTAGGQARWSTGVNATNGLAAGHVVVAAGDAKLVGLSADSGRTAWTYRIAQPAGLVTGDGTAFAADRDGAVHAVRTSDGTRLWRRPVEAATAALRYGDGTVYVGGAGGNTLALAAGTGAVRWSRRLGHGEGQPYGHVNAVGLSGGILYVGATDHTLYALDAGTGHPRWLYPAEVTTTSPPVRTAGLVFTGTRDGHVHALVPPSGGGSGGA